MSDKIFSLDAFTLFDGGFGTMLLDGGGFTRKLELYNNEEPQTVERIHRAYVEAGADVITTNTFGGNRFKLGNDVKSVNMAAVKLAKNAGAKFVALDVGPTGKMFEPMGDLTFYSAYEVFREQISVGAEAGADLVLVETMSDLREAKAAVIAALDCGLPVAVTMTYDRTARTFMGVSAAAATVALCALGISAVGVNCSVGADGMVDSVSEIVKYANVPVLVQPNAGLPILRGGKNIYLTTPDEFAQSMSRLIDLGVCAIGGCCGTTPAFIARLKSLIEGRSPVKHALNRETVFCSAQLAVTVDGVTPIGERLNPTGKPKLKNALINDDEDYIMGEATLQQANGARVLDVNVGIPEVDEKAMLPKVIERLQTATDLPLQIDSSSPAAIEAALKVYNGKAIINSVNGKEESMRAVLPLAKRYGAGVIGLTLDEELPKTAERRLEIAERIVDRAVQYGIAKENIIIDCLVLTEACGSGQGAETLKAVRLVKEKLGVKTVLGVSNVSFGLPDREMVNAKFLESAIASGLDMPIINPCVERYRDILSGAKKNNSKNADNGEVFAVDIIKNSESDEEGLIGDILRGSSDAAVKKVIELSKSLSANEIIDDYFVPALDRVSERYEKGIIFLPQMLSSADAVKAGLREIERRAEKRTESKGKIMLATVEGDIHDIGKNIVGMVLESYGFEVIDLGKDVKCEVVAQAVKESGVKLVGLSALMTTSIPFMKKTIALVKSCSNCKVMVGGAVLTEECARDIGADFYSPDASGSAKFALATFAVKK